MKVAFIGHRDIEVTEALLQRLTETVASLIEEKSADTFLFGSKSDFNNLCYEAVTKLKENYPDIQRVYVMSAYQYDDETYTEYLSTHYDRTFYPKAVNGAGNRSHLKRNQAMIDLCDVLVTYYDKDYRMPTAFKKAGSLKIPIERKSDTELAVVHAEKTGKEVINLFI